MFKRDAIDFLMGHDFPAMCESWEIAIERACILTRSDTLQPGISIYKFEETAHRTGAG